MTYLVTMTSRGSISNGKANPHMSSSHATGNDLINALRSIKGSADEDSIQILGSGAAYDPDVAVRTGSITFDYATGRGGIKKGSLVHIYGPEGSGKTTVALSTAAEIHRDDPEAGIAYFDMENALSPEWMEVQGVNLMSTPIVYSDHQEDFVNTARGLLESTINGTISNIPMMVLDSVAATHSKEVEESSADTETSRAKEPRVWSKHLNPIVKLMRKSGTIFFFLNQARDNQDMYSGGKYSFPGGRAIKHAATLNVLFKQTKALGEWEKGEKLMHGMEGAIEKNKMSGQLGKFIIRWYSNQKISRGWGLFDVLDQIERRDAAAKRSVNYDPETFQAAKDNIPYIKGFKWNVKTDEPESSANALSILFWDGILDAILEDDPDFNDKGLSGKSFANKASFVKFIDTHPALADIMEEYVLETLNLGLSDEEVEEIANSDLVEDADADDSDDDADIAEDGEEFDDEEEFDEDDEETDDDK